MVDIGTDDPITLLMIQSHLINTNVPWRASQSLPREFTFVLYSTSKQHCWFPEYKVDITGWIINTFPRNKTVDQIFIFFGKWLKHDTSLIFRSTCAKQLSKNNNKPATCARTSSLCIIYKVNADPYSTWTFNTRCWTLIIILRTERQKLQVFLLTVFFFSINIVGVDTLINSMYLM